MARTRIPLLLAVALGCITVALALSAHAAPSPAKLEPSAVPLLDTSSRDALDRETPRRTMEGFLKEGREGDFPVAASYLDLRAITPSLRDEDGPELARKLAYVLERRPTLNLAKVPDDPDGDPNAKVRGTFVADILYAGEQPVPIALARVAFPTASIDGSSQPPRWPPSRRSMPCMGPVPSGFAFQRH